MVSETRVRCGDRGRTEGRGGRKGNSAHFHAHFSFLFAVVVCSTVRGREFCTNRITNRITMLHGAPPHTATHVPGANSSAPPRIHANISLHVTSPLWLCGSSLPSIQRQEKRLSPQRVRRVTFTPHRRSTRYMSPHMRTLASRARPCLRVPGGGEEVWGVTWRISSPYMDRPEYRRATPATRYALGDCPHAHHMHQPSHLQPSRCCSAHCAPDTVADVAALFDDQVDRRAILSVALEYSERVCRMQDNLPRVASLPEPVGEVESIAG